MASDGPKFDTPDLPALPTLGTVRAVVTLLDRDTPAVIFIDTQGQAVSTFGVSDVLFENIRIAVLTALGPVGSDPSPLIVNGPGFDDEPEKPKKEKKDKKGKKDKREYDESPASADTPDEPADTGGGLAVEPIAPENYPAPADGDVDVNAAGLSVVSASVTIDPSDFESWYYANHPGETTAPDPATDPGLVADYIADAH